MLILNRNDHQTLCIGDDITIEVLEVNGLQVRFGITAPKSTVVVREELLRRNPECLSKGLTGRESHQEVVMQSGNENVNVNVKQPAKTSTTKPKIIYKRRKQMMDRQ